MRKDLPLTIENIKIIDVSSKGKSIAKYNDIIIFVDGGVPDDICDITVFRKKRKYWEANIKKIISHSKKRTIPECEHFGTCGGCKWQNINYKDQLIFKQNQIINNFKKIASLEIPKYKEIKSANNIYYYRNKLEFTFSNNRWLTQKEITSLEKIEDKNACGFHIPGMFNKIVKINKCHLQKDPSNNIRLSITKFAKENKISYYDIKEKKGLLRNLMIRNSSQDEIMVLIQFFDDDIKKINLLMNHIKEEFPDITSLLYTINQKGNSTIYDQEIICYYGKKYITEKIEGLYFTIGPKSFFQTNSEQVKILYKEIKKLSKINSTDIVYDLYTGTGTIAQYLASNAKKIIGIDSVNEAIDLACNNAKKNNINNCSFYTGDMKEIFNNEFINKNSRPNIIITNPPRDGMHKKVIEQILNIDPIKIIYISCNSATQARDISLLEKRYKTKIMQAVDMFPQTYHVENIAVLEKK